MNKLILISLIIIAFIVFMWTRKSSLEAFSDMRPWFGYEPGFGPGWGRKGCCNNATKESIDANNLA